MSGITSLLNVANNGLLTQQINLQTTGHNVANVNTPGFCRQNVNLAARTPTPMGVGALGNGVMATDIIRDYDRFVTNTLIEKSSIMSGLNTRQLGMKLVEGVFNEVDENGLNKLLNQFWAGWDDLANNAEGGAERTTLLQRASLLAQGITDRYDTLVKLSSEANLSIKTAIQDINRLADQIAQLNVQIVSMEAGQHQANDLRDQRDELVRELSDLAGIHYFETGRGSYTVLIGQGNPLVEADRSWHLEQRAGEVNWLGTAGQAVELTSNEVSEGELGGWMAIRERIMPRDTTILIGSRSNTSGGESIEASTRWDEIDGVTVGGDFTVSFSGTDQDGRPIGGDFTYTAPGAPPPPIESNATAADLLRAIEVVFQDTSVLPPIERVRATINEEGRIILTDLMPGDWPISFQVESISGNCQGLDLGKFGGSYPLNYLEQLNTFGEALIKAVNRQHAQGVGLIPYQETAGVYSAHNTDEPIGYRSSGLAFSDEVENGAFEIWLYDAQGDVVDYDPTTPEVNEPFLLHVVADTTSLEDIRDAVRNAQFAGSMPPAPLGLSANIVNGKLVIQTDGSSAVSGFAFGKDTSGALLALGLNAFFLGDDGSSIGINAALLEDQRLVAAAQVAPRGSEQAVSTRALREADRPIGLAVQSGTFSIWVYDQNNFLVDMDPTQPGQVDPVSVAVNPTVTSVQDILAAINDVDGLEAEIHGEKIRVSVTNPAWKGISFGPDSSGALAYLGVDALETDPIDGPQLASREAVSASSVALNSPASGLRDFGTITTGSFNVLLYEPDGSLVAGFPQPVPVDADPTLDEIVNQIGGFGGGILGVEAEVLPDNRLAIRANGGRRLILENDTSGVLDALGLAQMGTDMRGLYRVDRTMDPLTGLVEDVSDGQFYVYAYDSDGRILASALTGSDANTEGGAAVTAVTQWENIDGVTLNGAFHISFSGVDQQGQAISGTYDGDVGGPVVNDFSLAIEAAFGGSTAVDAFFNASGRLTLLSQDGRPISFQIDAITHDVVGDSGLDLGTINAAPSLCGAMANTEGGAPITEATQWQNIDGGGVTGLFQVRFSGVDQQGVGLSGTYTGNVGDMVGDLLTAVETAFGGASAVDATVDVSGRLALISQDGLPISFRIDGVTGVGPPTLDFGAISGLYTVGIDAHHDGPADIASRLDQMPGLSSQVADGRMMIQAEEGVATFVLAGDTTGFLKAMDLFTPPGGQFAPANNLNALSLRDLSRLALDDLEDVSLNEYYQGLVGTVGIHSQGFQLDYDFSLSAVTELQARRDEISGVSLDEEMGRLIKFQHSYTAAAKLIKAADEMLLSLLEIK